MFTKTFIRTTQKILLLAAGACVIAALGTNNALAAANCSITTDPSPATITEGGSITFTGSITGKSPKNYSWTFEGGSPSTSNGETETVTYTAAGTYTATLNGTNGKGDQCSASVNVTVNEGGGMYIQ